MQEDTRHSERKLDQQNINHINNIDHAHCENELDLRDDSRGAWSSGMQGSHARLAANTNATQKNIIQTLIQQIGNNHKHTLQWILAFALHCDVPS